jgi:prevent-host-death family protein
LLWGVLNFLTKCGKRLRSWVDVVRKVCILSNMETTLTDLRRNTGRVARAVDRGEEVILTDHGRPVCRLQPYIPRVVYDDPAALRQGSVSDRDILEAVRESREDLAEHQSCA